MKRGARTVSFDEWIAEAKGLFGTRAQVRFVCPACGHIASVQQWLDAGAKIEHAGFSCIGRWIEGSRSAMFGNGKGPCDYAGGGLFRLNPVTVVFKSGESADMFEFDRG